HRRVLLRRQHVVARGGRGRGARGRDRVLRPAEQGRGLHRPDQRADPHSPGRRRPRHPARGKRRLRRGADERRRRARARRVSGRAAQLLRPQAGGVPGRVGRRVAPHARVRRRAFVILAVDQGTTGTTCLLVDDELHVVSRGYRELPQHFPQPGWVEHDPEEIWRTVEESAADAGGEYDTVAITNQRETTILWDRATGEPVAPAIVWQDRRTAARCRELDPDLIRTKTGLVPDPYFSATKLELLLREHRRDNLAFGTVDSWLVWKLTHGEHHVIDVTNASRTLLFNLETRDWDDELLALFGVPREVLPRIVGSADEVGEGELNGRAVTIRGIAGDQQAALYGQGCHAAGDGKATYGTGSFVLVHTGDDASPPPHGLLKTAAADGYALEGAVLVSGAAIQWLRDGLGLVGAAPESEALAESVDSTGGVHFVPALAGLGSPWWDADARGLVTGLT